MRTGAQWALFDVGEVLTMPAIGFDRIALECGKYHEVQRHWFHWDGSGWLIDIGQWAQGMVEGPTPPWSPSPLSELISHAVPSSLISDPVLLREAVGPAAERVDVPLAPIPADLDVGDSAVAVVAEVGDKALALVATSTSMVVISSDDRLRWTFVLAACGFTEKTVREDEELSKEVLRQIPSGGSRLVLHLHQLCAMLGRNEGASRGRP